MAVAVAARILDPRYTCKAVAPSFHLSSKKLKSDPHPFGKVEARPSIVVAGIPSTQDKTIGCSPRPENTGIAAASQADLIQAWSARDAALVDT